MFSHTYPPVVHAWVVVTEPADGSVLTPIVAARDFFIVIFFPSQVGVQHPRPFVRPSVRFASLCYLLPASSAEAEVKSPLFALGTFNSTFISLTFRFDRKQTINNTPVGREARASNL